MHGDDNGKWTLRGVGTPRPMALHAGVETIGNGRRERRDSLPTRARGFKGVRRSTPLLKTTQRPPAQRNSQAETLC